MDHISRKIAMSLIVVAKEKEKSITLFLKEVSSKGSGQLQGLDHKLKSVESLTRKLIAKSQLKKVDIEAYAKEISDVLRYTNVSSGDKLVDDYFVFVEEFRVNGYNFIDVKNSFIDKFPAYKGVNTTVEDPDGFRFEIGRASCRERV